MTTESDRYIVAIQPMNEAERVLCDLVATTDLRAAPESIKRRIAAVLKAPSPTPAPAQGPEPGCNITNERRYPG